MRGAAILLLVWLALLAVPAPAAAAVDFPDDSGFSPAQQAEIDAAVAQAGGALDVRVFSTLPVDSHGSARLAAQQISGGSGGPVLVWGGPHALPAFGVAGSGQEACAEQAVRNSDFDEHQQFVELARLVAAGTGCAAMDEALARRFRDTASGPSPSGGVERQPASTTTWVLRGLVIVVCLGLLGSFGYFRGRSWRADRERKQRAEALTGFASEASRRSAREQAHADLLAFGEELDGTAMLPEHRMSQWQLALDDYAEAARIQECPGGPGGDQAQRVSELVASGREHLRQAVGGRPGNRPDFRVSR